MRALLVLQRPGPYRATRYHYPRALPTVSFPLHDPTTLFPIYKHACCAEPRSVVRMCATHVQADGRACGRVHSILGRLLHRGAGGRRVLDIRRIFGQLGFCNTSAW